MDIHEDKSWIWRILPGSPSENYLDRQRQVLLAFYVVLLSLGIMSNLLGLAGSFVPFFTASNAVFIVVVWLWVLACLIGKLSLTGAIDALAVTTQCFIGTDIVYSALVPTLRDNEMLILIHMLILVANMMFSLAAYQPRLTRLLSFMAIVTYVVSMEVTGDASLHNYFFMLMLVMAFVGVLSFLIAQNGAHLVAVNQELQRDELELMRLLRVNKKQIMAYVALAKQSHEVDETAELFDLMTQTSQKNIIENVKTYLYTKDFNLQSLESVFPELSESEREICHLILQDKKLGEICTLLGKTESNVTTQRANIRKKLGLDSTQNLKSALKQRIMPLRSK